MNLKLIYEKLLSEYGEQGWWPIIINEQGKYHSVYDKEFKNKSRSLAEKFEISVGAILTQNTSWKNVEKALINLKKQGLLTPNKLIKKDVKDLIRPAGYYNIKEKKLKTFSKFFLEHKSEFEHNSIPRGELLSIWGVGNETADSILLYAMNKPFFVVDAYTRRFFSRIENHFDFYRSYDEVQSYFHKKLPHDYKLFNEFHALIVQHAKVHCRKKPICDGCPFNTVKRVFR